MKRSIHLTARQRATVFLCLACTLFAQSIAWWFAKSGHIPEWLPAVLAFSGLFAMLLVFMRAGLLRKWVLAGFVGLVAGLAMLSMAGLV